MDHDWYSRKEVSEILGISSGTVYHWAKQGKIVKLPDPHNNRREARYRKAEVDELFQKRQESQPDGIRPAALANRFKVPVARIYNIIREKNLPVTEFPVGDERTGISIPEELLPKIKEEIEKSLPKRGTPAEFYNHSYDIALFQKFLTPSGQEVRVVRNETLDWGFYHQSRSWIPFLDAIQNYSYVKAYEIHKKNVPVKGYVDLRLPKGLNDTFEFLDFVYENWGVENIRLREHEDDIDLSIKSGIQKISSPLSTNLSSEILHKYILEGQIIPDSAKWELVSGTKSMVVDLPVVLIEKVKSAARRHDSTINAYIQKTLEEKIDE